LSRTFDPLNMVKNGIRAIAKVRTWRSETGGGDALLYTSKIA
jgi:hypothetical protein